jgi:Bacterial PH domain
MVLLAAWFGWRVFRYAGPVAGCLVSGCLLSFAVPIMRACLVVTDEGLIDRRTVRTVRVPWQQIAEFRVARPGGPWGGFCVVADCHDGAQIDLLSARAYSRVPSSRHLDDLWRICWTLEERLAEHGQN